MKNVFISLVLGFLSFFLYIVAFALKRHLFPADIVLTEGLILLFFFLPSVFITFYLFHRFKILHFTYGILVWIIFLLSAACFNLTVPAILDRSITLYLLNTLDNHQNGMTKEEVKSQFLNIYVTRNDAIQKRLYEQIHSNNVNQQDQRFFITMSGHHIIKVSRFLSSIFKLDDKIIQKNNP